MTHISQSHTPGPVVRFQDVQMRVVQGPEGPGFASAEVASGFACAANHLRVIRTRHASELVEGKHWFYATIDTPRGPRRSTMWTQRGIVRLGFFLTSARAKAFRDWAEDLVLSETGASLAPGVARLAEGLSEGEMTYMLFRLAQEKNPEVGDALFAAAQDAFEAMEANQRKRASMARAQQLLDRQLVALGR